MMLVLVLVGMGGGGVVVEGGGDVDRFYESVGGVSRATVRGDVKGKRGVGGGCVESRGRAAGADSRGWYCFAVVEGECTYPVVAF